jgi:hypothetical protein
MSTFRQTRLGLITSSVENDPAREFVNDMDLPLSPTREESDMGDERATIDMRVMWVVPQAGLVNI